MTRHALSTLITASFVLTQASGFVPPTTVIARMPNSLTPTKLPPLMQDRTRNSSSVGKEPSAISVPTKKVQGSLVAALSAVVLGPFALTFLPYVACLAWGLPSTNKIGNKKSRISNVHRVGGVCTLVLPLVLAGWEALVQSHPPLVLYGLAVATATANLGLGAALILRKVPAYDIPTLRAFATGVFLGFSFLGSSLTFVLGRYRWYYPIGAIFSAVAIYATVFACSDALQHARLFLLRSKPMSPRSKENSPQRDNGSTEVLSLSTKDKKRQRFWYLPFERANVGNVFLKNLWRQPTPEALRATVSPPNGVVVFTTTMTAAFACLGLLQIRYVAALRPTGMAALCTKETAFCRWSTYQALLAVVANNFGTFAGTLVIQRRNSQKEAGLYNALGLLIPVLNIFAFFLAQPTKAGSFFKLMLLPSNVCP